MHQQIKVFILIIVIKKIVNRIRTWCGSIQSFLFNLPDKLKTFLLYTNKKYGTLHEFEPLQNLTGKHELQYYFI
jgi:hypothetical protein